MISNKKNKPENPIYSVLFNIVIPVLILKNGNKWLGKILGHFDFFHEWENLLNYSSMVFASALIFPIAYFIYDFIKRKNINVISILGFINILLTGGIGVFGSSLGLSKNWFILK